MLRKAARRAIALQQISDFSILFKHRGRIEA